jgi:hypothetical protein
MVRGDSSSKNVHLPDIREKLRKLLNLTWGKKTDPLEDIYKNVI